MSFQGWRSLRHRFIKQHIFIAVPFLVFAFSSPSLLAERPLSGVEHPLYGEEAHYRMDYVDQGWRLSIRADNTRPAILHDLSDCRFCAAESANDESDNCLMDGVFPLDLNQQQGIGVVCHVGAHSQRFNWFDVGKTQPPVILTGNYFVQLYQDRTGLQVTYDRFDAAGEPAEYTQRFSSGTPALAAGTPQRLPDQLLEEKP